MSAMTKVEFFHVKPGAKGPRYFWEPSPRLRKTGWRGFRLDDDLATAIAQAIAQNEKLAAWQAETGGADKARAGAAGDSVKAMIVAYQQSRFWRRLKPKTKQDYARYLAIIDRWIGDQPARSITPQMVEGFYETLLKSGKVHSANACMRVLRLLFAAGRRLPRGGGSGLGFVASNPAADLGMEGAERLVPPIIWSEEQIDAMVETADSMGRHSVGTAILLNAWLGQRVNDVLLMTRDAYRGGKIFVRQGKTGARVALPVDMVPRLASRIADELARIDARFSVVATIEPGGGFRPGELIVSEETGRGYTRDNFTHIFADIRAIAAERHPDVVPGHIRFTWLRHTAVTRMAEAGGEIAEIAAITGHTLKSVITIIEHYLVRTGAMARSVFERRLDAIERERLVASAGGRRPGTFAADDDA